ncbi:MAG TPA: 4Fe-4S binding protein [Deltaproteobacteria bacterium]|nr:4Fe-4S binding protein [Deltaproteobacteria bacterium]HPJ93843.1 4Fe-4S binding protein [Deltaproteobacteria bacterium]HPR50197.1 4Fe-4S binding protein [Deltaproteobacteria bacterium]
MPEAAQKQVEYIDIKDLRPLPAKKKLPRHPPVIVFNPSKCTGCSTCEMVCSNRNVDKVAPASSSIKVLRNEEEGKNFAALCLHCREPLCLEACPTRAIDKDDEGIVRIRRLFCVECGICTLACPESAPMVEPVTGKIRKCDLCEGDPLCVKHCPEGALHFYRGKAVGWIKYLRWPVQLLSFLLLVVVLVGTFCYFTAGVVSLPCPTGTLQNIAATKHIVFASAGAALVLIVLTILLGRAFCGWVCPFGFFLDLVGSVVPKFGLPKFLKSRMIKYGILGGAIGGAAGLGFQPFCTVCPIGSICRSYGVSGVLQGAELAIVPAIASLELGQRRSWCRYFCPVGAVLALAAKIGLIKIVIGAKQCKKFSCMQCADICPMGIIDREALREGTAPKIPMDECILCMRCVDTCPYSSAKIRFRWQKTIPGEVKAWTYS